MWSNKILKTIFNRTNGRCHFCGDKVMFERYGLSGANNANGIWETDHVTQKGKGGPNENENCLPACWKCNRLRWNRKGADIRNLLILGLIARDEIKNKTNVGVVLKKLENNRENKNKKRRRIKISG